MRLRYYVVSVIADVSGTVSADVWFIAGSAPTSHTQRSAGGKQDQRISTYRYISNTYSIASGASAISTWTTALTQWGTLIVNLSALTTSTVAVIEIFLLEN